MAREREVKVTVLGEDKGASKALKSVDDAAAKLSPTGASANKVLGMLGSTLGSHLGPAGGIVEKGLKGLPDMFKRSTTEGLNLGNMLKGGIADGAAAAGTALLAFALKGVGDFQKVTGEVRQLKNVMGSTAEEASKLRNVGVMLGIDTDTMAKGMLKLSINLERTKGDFAGVHVETAKNADGTTNLVKTLDNVRAAYQSLKDPQQKNIFLTEAMSKAGVNLRGVMSLSNAEFERFKKSGTIITDADLKMALEYSRAQRDLGLATQSLSVSAGKLLVPALTEVTQRTAQASRFADEHKGAVDRVGQSLLSGVAHANPLTGALWDLSGSHKGAGSEAEKHAAQGAALKGSLHELGIEISEDEEKTGQLTESTKKAQAAAEAYKAKIEGLAGSLSTAMTTMGSKTFEVTEKQREMAKAFLEAQDAANQLKQGMDMLIGVHVSAARASIAWHEQVKATGEGLMANKRSLDITTEAGRANQKLILDQIADGVARVDSLTREGASLDVTSAAMAGNTEALRRNMQRAGYTKEQIDRLIESYGLLAAQEDIEKNITTNYFEKYHVSRENNTNLGTAGDPRGPVQKRAGGMSMGPVRGRRGEAIPIIAHGGEWVLNEDDLARLRAAGGGGTWSAPSGAGAGTVVVHVHAGTVVGANGAEELGAIVAPHVRTQLLQLQRRTPLGFDGR